MTALQNQGPGQIPYKGDYEAFKKRIMESQADLRRIGKKLTYSSIVDQKDSVEVGKKMVTAQKAHGSPA